MSDGFKFHINTLAGSSFSNFRRFTKGKTIDPQYRNRYLLSGIVSFLVEPLRWIENARNNGRIAKMKITEEPIFILGHWRSGTTYLHNLMSQDPNMGFVTTYQGVFPNQLLSMRWLFLPMMKVNMPKRRLADNVVMGPDLPQEEGFAMCNMNPLSFYSFWFFPRQTQEFCEKYLLMKGFTEEEKTEWKRDYLILIKKALLNTKGKRFISKNPPHTANIPLLLEMFPNAKFIHIYRNPLTVFPSTLNFFRQVIPTVGFQEISREELEDNIFYVYDKMMNKYEADKVNIPTDNLIEIRYEDFEKEPLAELEKIYEKLNIPDFEKSRHRFQTYIDSQEEFQTNSHKMSQHDVDRIVHKWRFFMTRLGYEIPGEETQRPSVAAAQN